MALKSLVSRLGFLLTMAILSSSTTATTHEVSASGDGLLSLSDALKDAQPGDTISLADGIYDTALESYTDGEDGSPITIEGSSDAIINGINDDSRSVLITHSFIALKGFTVEGKIGDSSDSDAYGNKCVYVDGGDSGLEGFVMEQLTIRNCGGECVRLKHNVVNAEILDNTIENCGIHDFEYDSDEKIGEGIYIGTSSDQWEDSDTPDNCIGNVVMGNIIITNGNECVDIKEGSTDNIVEDNTCSNQLDEASGCFGIQGDNNILRYNRATGCLGTCVRIGGDDVDGYSHGQGNDVYDNYFRDCSEGSINLRVAGQGTICGNTCEDGNCLLRGISLDTIEDTWDQDCDDGDD